MAHAFVFVFLFVPHFKMRFPPKVFVVKRVVLVK